MQNFHANFQYAKTTGMHDFFSTLMSDDFMITYVPGDQEGLFKLAIQLRTFFYSVIYNTATG
jgi:hypothetical protein